MLREAAHFLRYSPEALSLKASRSEVELYEAIFDRADAAGFAEERETLVSDLAGDILEVGCGTGRTFRHYGPGVRLTAIDTDDAFRAVAENRRPRRPLPCPRRRGVGDLAPFEAESFDAVVFSLVLCSVNNVGRALSETARVLRPRGKLRALEHVRSAHPIAGAVMRALDPFWVVLNGMGCHMARDTEAAIARAGFAVEDAQRFQLFAPCLPAFPLRRITASPPARSSPPA